MSTGVLEEADPLDIPNGYVIGEYWKALLEDSLKNTGGAHYAAYLHLGMVLFAAGEEEKAYEMWEKSAELKSNPWALRNMAAVLIEEKRDLEKAADYSVQALYMLPENRNLAIDCANTLYEAGQYERLLQVTGELSEELQELGRVQLAKVRALIALGRLEEAKSILTVDFVLPDVQEGENSVSGAWISLHEKILMRDGMSEEEAKERVEEIYPVPYELDFRMG